MSSFQMTQREKRMAIVVGGALAIFIVYYLVDFFAHTYHQQQVDSKTKATQLQAMQTLLANAGLWEQRDAWLQAKQPKIENEATAGVQLLNMVLDQAKKAGVTPDQQAIANPDHHPNYISVSITLETRSTWKALVQFLYALQGPEKFIVVESANLKIDPKDQTQMHGKFRISKWFAPK